MKQLLLAIIFILVSAFAADAQTTWYVGQGTGDSDSNSCAQAQTDTDGNRKLTIQAGLACVGYTAGAGANDIVEVRAGTYTHSTPIGGNNDQSFPSGTSWSAPFILRCKTGETCTLRGTSPQNLYLTNTGAMFATIGAGTSPATGGFVFDGVNLSGDQVFMGNCCQSPSSIELLGNEFINTNKENAIYVGNFGTDVRLRYNYIHGGEFVTTANAQGRNHAMYFTANNSLIEYNRIEDIKGYGYHGYYESDASGNTIRYNYIKNFTVAPNTGCGILTFRNNNLVLNNVVWSDDAARTGQKAICNSGSGNIVYNNTVYGMTYFGISLYGAVTPVTRNNIIRNTTGNSDFENISGTYSNNICGAAATGCASSSDPLFVDAAGGNFALTASSSAIDAGTSSIATGITKAFNGSAPDAGVFETFGITSCEVGLIDNSTVDCTFTDNVAQPLLPSTSVTGFTTTAGTISTATRSGNTHILFGLSAPFAGGASTVSYATGTGNVTNSALIGRTFNQRLNAITNFSITDNTGGGGGPTLAYTHGRFYLLQGATDITWSAKGIEDAGVTTAPGSKLNLRWKVANTGTLVNLNPRVRVRYDGGSYVELTGSFVNGIKALGTGTQLGTVMTEGSSITQDQLTSTHGNVACTYTRTASAVPTLALTTNSESECAQAIEFDTTVTAGKVYDFLIYTDTGTAISGGPISVTIGNYSSTR